MRGFIPGSLPFFIRESMYSRSSSSKMMVVLLTERFFGDNFSLPCYTYYALKHILYVSLSNPSVIGRIQFL